MILVIHPEDEGSKVLRKVGILPCLCTVAQCRKWFASSSPWEPQISIRDNNSSIGSSSSFLCMIFVCVHPNHHLSPTARSCALWCLLWRNVSLGLCDEAIWIPQVHVASNGKLQWLSPKEVEECCQIIF